MSKEVDESKGRWRTICGRRVFIEKGQSLSEAMKKSGKFSKADINQATKGPQEKSKTVACKVRVNEKVHRVQNNGDTKAKSNTANNKEYIADYVKRFRAGESVEGEIEIATVGKRERDIIEKFTGEKITATTHVLTVDELQHIEKGHGEKGSSDHSMANIANYKHIAEVLSDPDPNTIDYCRYPDGNIRYSKKYKDKNGKPAKLIMLTKTFNNHIQMVVEAVCDTKAGKLHVITSYTCKKKEDKK